MAAAVAFPPDAPRIRGLRDSKELNARQRRILADRIRQRACACGIGAASVREIDRINIRQATALAMRRALRRVIGTDGLTDGQTAGLLSVRPSVRLSVLLDGLPLPELGYDHEALVDGDALCYSIAAAGVVAKTVRDRLMTSLDRRYPRYRWSSNKGYASEDHLAAINQHGATPHHRTTFAPVAQLKLF